MPRRSRSLGCSRPDRRCTDRCRSEWRWGVRGAPAHCVWSQVAPGATQTPQLALQQTCPVLQVFRPHIEIVFCDHKVSALCTAWSQADGAEPAAPSVALVPAAPPVLGGRV